MSWASDLWHSTTDVIGDVWDGVTDVMVDMIPTASTIIGGIVGGPAGAAAGADAGYGIGDAISDFGSGVESYLNKEAAKDQLEDEQNFNAGQAQLNRDFQREERLQTQQFNLDMWNKNNAYNSPAAQIERAKSAGINPNIAVESLSRSSANPVTSSPMSGSVASSPGSLASAMLLQSAQIANLNAQTRKANTEANINEQEYSYNNVTFIDRVNSLKYANEEIKASIDKIIADKDLQKQAFEFLARYNEEQLNNLRELTNKYRAEVYKIKVETDGQLIDNSLNKLKYDFSKESGIPHGTSLEEALWKTVVNGEFDELLNKFIESVESTTIKRLGSMSETAFGENVVDDFIERLERATSGVSPHKNGRKGDARTLLRVTPPKSVYNP